MIGMTDAPGSPIGLLVNGQCRSLSVDPRASLLDLVRDHTHLTGTKEGCDHGGGVVWGIGGALREASEVVRHLPIRIKDLLE
jgi:xanthine dehydrogenase iron-sulfur cluster and FAD-binding subunit A